MKTHIVEVNGYVFHIIVDGQFYEIRPEGQKWSSSAYVIGDPLECAVRHIRENFLFFLC